MGADNCRAHAVCRRRVLELYDDVELRYHHHVSRNVVEPSQLPFAGAWIASGDEHMAERVAELNEEKRRRSRG